MSYGENGQENLGRFFVMPPDDMSTPNISPVATVYQELPDGRYVIHDAMFPEPTIVGGENSTVTSSTIVAMLHNRLSHPHQGGTPQLVQAGPEGITNGMGEWSYLDHQIGVARLILGLEELPPVFTAAGLHHDITKGVGGHPVEGLFEGRGHESWADHMLESFLQRSGIYEQLAAAGVAEAADGWLPEFGMELSWVMSLLHPPIQQPEGTHIMNYPSGTGFLDPDRVQYIVGEAMRWFWDIPTAREVINAVEYHPNTPFGPQLVMANQEAARALFQAQVIESSHDWNNLLGVIGDMVFARMLMSYDLASPNEGVEGYHLYDQLYTAQGIMRQRLLDAANVNPLISALGKIEHAVAAHIRDQYGDLNGIGVQAFEVFTKEGIEMPEWLNITQSQPKSHDQFEAFMPDVAPGNVSRFDQLYIDVHPGKLRRINPVVRAADGYVRLLDVEPDLMGWARSHRRFSTHSLAAIDVHHPKLGLTYEEKRQLATMHHDVMRRHWYERLKAPEMPAEVLQSQLQAADKYVRCFGEIALSATQVADFYRQRYGERIRPML